MTTTLESAGSVTRAEVFSVPGDYPSVECDGGHWLVPGVYWWYLESDGTPSGYPSGPFSSALEAMADWDAAGSHEPQEE